MGTKRLRPRKENVDYGEASDPEQVEKGQATKKSKPSLKTQKRVQTPVPKPSDLDDVSTTRALENGAELRTEEKKDAGAPSGAPSYWLMKAEPESRMENGVDVRFSIDDLAAATKPEGWDGVRNAVARNNMRAMSKGDLAFFYHSNCKVPGIVGIMEIVEEHTVDGTAHDPIHPYYDPKDSPEKPKWSLVHVEFRRKFDKMVSLKELQAHRGPGGELEALQTLKQSRLSVSKVSEDEWNFILGLVEKTGDA